MLKIFVEQRKDITEKELLDYNTFCSLLPGASSTQILLIIAYKKGGTPLACFTLFLWVLPATVLMGALSIFLTAPIADNKPLSYFRFLQPMVVGFIIYAGYRSFLQIWHSKVLVSISIFLALICLLFYKSPLIIPVVLIAGGLFARFSLRISASVSSRKKPAIRWVYLTLFIFVFIISGILSELSKKNNWSERSYFNLFENCYRFGSIVFGGGDVMIPVMYEQYVARPSSQRVKSRNQNVLKIEKDLFLSGAGIVRTLPGPLFSFSAFAGGATMTGRGVHHQIGGIMTATMAIFLPSLLLVLFFHPLWEYIQRYQSLTPIFKGIQASTVAIMLASGLYLLKDAIFHQPSILSPIDSVNMLAILMTLLLLLFRVISPLYITVTFLSLGVFY